MKNLMLDLETMGSSPGAAIVQIGAVEFNVTGIGHTFKCTVDLQSNLDYGLRVDGDTVLWWLRQSGPARKSIAGAPGIALPLALRQFADFVKDCGVSYVWGNGATFDNVILSEAYRLTGERRPWHYRGDRDVRTLVAIARAKEIHISTQKREGVQHDALDDARYQAEYTIELLRNL